MTRQATDESRRSIERRVRDLGPALARLRPPVVVATLAGAALWPVVAPLVGTGVAVAVAGGLMGLLGGPGQAVVTDFLQRAARGHPEAELQAALERELAAAMAGDSAQAAELRDGVGRLLQRVRGIEVALASADEQAREGLAAALTEISSRWEQFEWMLSDVHDVVAAIAGRQAEALALQRRQLDLQREQLVKTNLLLRTAQPQRAVPKRPDAGSRSSRGTTGARPASAPYKGLQAFEADDAERFFGRDALRAELLARVAESRLLALVGDSGSGKSSLLRAGLLRAVWDGALPESSSWPVVLLTPGAEPLATLATHVADVRGISSASLLADLGEYPGALALAARQAVIGAPAGARLLVVVDQLEEIFTLGASEPEQRRFIEALLAATRDQAAAATLIVAIRSDFIGRLAAYPGVPEALRGNQVLVGPLRDDELAEVIEGPAASAGATVQRELVEMVVNEVRGEPGALPLVSHALLETYERGDGRELTVADYLAAGGVRGAIGKTADSALARMTPAGRTAARRVLLRLTAVGEGTEPTRRRLPRAELVPASRGSAADAMIDELISARLLTSSKETVEVAHEALIRHWPTLRDWVEEDREALRIQEEIGRAARLWRNHERDAGDLLRGAGLAAATEWSREHHGELTVREREFLAASRSAERDELDAARRQARRFRTLAAALGVVALIAAGSAAIAVRSADRAQEEQELAERQARTATSRRLAALSADRLRSDVDAALLLGLEAYLREPTAEARSALVGAIGAAPRLVATLRGHAAGSSVQRVVFSPTGKTLASADSRGGVMLWDPRRGRAVAGPLRAGNDHTSVALGRGWLAAAGSRLVLWTIAVDQAPRLRAQRSAAGLLDIAATGTGALATSGQDGRVRLWRLPSLQLLTTLRAHRGAVPKLSAGGDVLAAVDQANSRALVWRLGDAPELLSVPTNERTLIGIASAPDGSGVVTAGWSGIRVWDPVSGALRAHDRFGALPFGVAWSKDGRVAAAAGDGTVRVWETSALDARWPPLQAGPADAPGVAFSPDGDTLASAGADSSVRLWSVRSPVAPSLSNTPATGPASAIALASDGDAVVVLRRDGEVHYSPAAGERPLSRAGSVERGVALAMSADGRRIATAAARGAIAVRDARTLRRLGARAESVVDPVATLDDRGRTLAVGSFRATGVRVLDAARGGRGTLMPDSRHPVRVLAFAPRGRLLASGNDDGSVRLWDVRGRRATGGPLPFRAAAITGLSFAPDGRTLAAAGADGRIDVVDLRTRSRASLGTLGLATEHVALAFSPDGRTLAAADGRLIRLYDVARRRPLGSPLAGHEAAVRALAFGPGGALVSADAAGAVVRWDPLLSSEHAPAWRARVCRMVGRPLLRGEWDDVLPDEPYRPTCA